MQGVSCRQPLVRGGFSFWTCVQTALVGPLVSVGERAAGGGHGRGTNSLDEASRGNAEGAGAGRAEAGRGGGARRGGAADADAAGGRDRAREEPLRWGPARPPRAPAAPVAAVQRPATAAFRLLSGVCRYAPSQSKHMFTRPRGHSPVSMASPWGARLDYRSYDPYRAKSAKPPSFAKYRRQATGSIKLVG